MRVGTIASTGYSITIAGVARLNGAGVGALGAAVVGEGSTIGATGCGAAGSVLLSGLGVRLEHPTNAKVIRSVPIRVRMRSMDISDEMHF